eukprot:4033464-Amphidinium_carterae.1
MALAHVRFGLCSRPVVQIPVTCTSVSCDYCCGCWYRLWMSIPAQYVALGCVHDYGAGAVSSYPASSVSCSPAS